MKKISEVLNRQEFYPGFVGFFTNPFYFGRRELVRNVKALAPKRTGRVLDVGCGTKPYSELFKNISYVGLELDTPENRRIKNADFFYNGKKFPFSDGEFDCAISNQVLEHVFEPDLFLKEINRVLKTGGLLLLTVPFMWEEHEEPYDFGRYSSFGLRAILDRNGFKVIEHKKTLNDFRAVFQMINCHFRKLLRFKNSKIRLISHMIVFGALNALGSVLAFVLPKNNAFYIDNVVLAKKKDGQI